MPWVASALPAQGHDLYSRQCGRTIPGAGQTKVETFTVLSADGTSHDIVITITGTNDVPVIAGDDTGAVTEDASTPNLTDTGTLTIVDADGGQAVFQTTGITSSAGALGSLSITSAGAWALYSRQCGRTIPGCGSDQGRNLYRAQCRWHEP
ncbi:VCBS domain-containing protein [Acinetobacter towneri]|uniref:VCBS domain-containing protein n=1 Tax=Acinetobacter towneri TaxID=202956 RepID=UPI002934F75A|nr:VCBS domain-containing protein [Acinetobacter towneri]WOE28711.1 VCBS domain-containing protein [Acinetobacter towneri]